MKPTRHSIPRSILTVSAAVLCAFTAAPKARSASGIWTGDGLWETPENWAGGIVADGAAFTADFRTLDIEAE